MDPRGEMEDQEPTRKRLKVDKKLKQVTFAKSPQFFYIEASRHDDDDSDNEENLKETTGTSQAAERTSQLTVLSSLHCKVRQELRKITKFDLQSAVKYGVKTKTSHCRKTRMPRWKYVYGNVVYITDHTSTKQVTCYKEEIHIDPAVITSDMITRHDDDVQALRDDPQLCTTHSVIIIDQSGSMRESDVSGFCTRSRMAYGVLALEYIAEQLHARGSDDDGIIDTVSIIEMNDTGTIVINREPLDWILFNKVLERKNTAKPRSHGNYNNSLFIAKKLIDQEISQAGGYSNLDDLPSYALILLSDGKPSDCLPWHSEARSSILSSILMSLSTKLTFRAIGLGASGADFSALESMVAYAKAAGTDAEFAYSQLCAAELSTAFSSIATSMTATRIEMNRVKEASDGKRKKDVKLRGRHVPQDERRYKSYSNEVSRWRYDHDEFKKNRKSVPWCKIPFKNDDAASFIMEDKPFGRGAERLAYMFQETDNAGRPLGKLMVAKESISIDSEERKLGFHKHFCRVQRKSSKLAELFNKQVKQRTQLWPVDDGMQAPKLSFVRCFVYTYEADDGEECGLLVEPYLKGKFTKYNGNNGFLPQKKSGPKVDLAIGEVHLTDFLQAFSHWTYFHTNHELLVCDLQGVLNEEGRFPQFELTDPCICSKKGKGNIRYGKTDIRYRGFRSFRRTHECNLVCKGLGLPSFGRRR